MDNEPWIPKPSESGMRRLTAESMYDLHTELLRQGWPDSTFVYDQERDLFRFRDGKFAFSRTHGTGSS